MSRPTERLADRAGADADIGSSAATGARERVVRLAETVTVTRTEDGLRLFRGVDSLRIKGPADALLVAANQLRAGISWVELMDRPSRSPMRQMERRLRSIGWIVEHDRDHGAGTSTERQVGYLTLFGADAVTMQRRLDSARVGVLGVGAVGSVLAQHLVGSGVRRLWLVDHDRVALNNLNRQFLAGRSDVGGAKTAVAARALRRLAPSLQVHRVDRQIRAAEELDALPANLDLLAIAADTPWDIVSIAWEWARPRGVPICVAAVGLGTGYWGPLLVPGLGHCWGCFERLRQAELTGPDALAEFDQGEATPYSFGPANTVVSALLAHEAVRYLASGECGVLNERRIIRFAENRMSYFSGSHCTCGASQDSVASMASPHTSHTSAPLEDR